MWLDCFSRKRGPDWIGIAGNQTPAPQPEGTLLRALQSRPQIRSAPICWSVRISSRSNPPRKYTPRWSPVGWVEGIPVGG
jgi:hypothetical protein